MALDPSIILQGQGTQAPQQLQNPMDSMIKAVTLKNLMNQSQGNDLKLTAEKRDMADDTAMRNAYQNNVVANPDGSQSVNRQGVLSDLNKQNPMLAMKANAQFQQSDLDQMTKRQQIAKDLAWSMNDPTSYDSARKQAMQLGVSGADKMPEEYDPSYVSHLKMATLTATEQLAAQQKAIDQGVAQQKNDIEKQDLNVKTQQFQYGKQFDANNQVQTALEGSRQSQDAQRALQDVYSAKKVNTLIDQAGGDLNKLNPQQVRLLYGEVAKMATGGAPSETEMESLTPANGAQKVADMLQKVTNKSAPANAGEFVSQVKDYADGVAADGKALLSTRANKIIDQRKYDLGPRNYQQFKGNVDSFSDPTKAFGKTGPVGGAGGKDKAAVLPFDQWKAQQAGNGQ